MKTGTRVEVNKIKAYSLKKILKYITAAKMINTDHLITRRKIIINTIIHTTLIDILTGK